MFKFKSTSFYVFLVLVTCSCANHLRTETLNDPRKVISEPKMEYFIILEKEVMNTPRLTFKVEQLETREHKEAQDISEVEFFTPYEGVREMYEFPVGLVMLPISITINFLDFATLGLIPNSFTDATLSIAFAGLNPALNIESDSRSEHKTLKTYEKIISVNKVKNRVAARNVTVTFSDDKDFKATLQADEKGNVVLDLLSKQFMNNIQKLRQLNVTVGKEESADTKKIIITREFYFKIKKAKETIGAFYSSKTPENLAKAIYELEKKLGFEKLAADLEKRVVDKQDAAFKKRYDKKLEELYQ